METVEVRCPVDPRRMFSKLRLEGKKPTFVEGNLIEFSCDNCKATLRRRGTPVKRVLHRYDFMGELIETLTED